MFFPVDILRNRGSKLAVVWRAATIKLKSRDKAELLSVDIADICNELAQQSNPSLNGSENLVKGFSLRLTAQLLHGVMIIMDFQVKELSVFAKSAEKSLEFTVVYEKMMTNAVDLESVSSLSIQQDIGDISDSSAERRHKRKLDQLHLLDDPYVLPTFGNIPDRLEVNRTADLYEITLPPDLPQTSESNWVDTADQQMLLPEPDNNQYDLASLMKDVEEPNQGMFMDENLQTPEAAIRTEQASPHDTPSKSQPQGQEPDSVLAVPLPEDELDTTYNQIPPEESNLSPQMQLDPLTEEDINRIRKTKKLHIDPKTVLSSDYILSRLVIPKPTIESYIEDGHMVNPSVISANDIFKQSCVSGRKTFSAVGDAMIEEELEFLRTNPNWEEEVDETEIGFDSSAMEQEKGEDTTTHEARAGVSGIGSGVSMVSELNQTERSGFHEKLGRSESILPEMSTVLPEINEEFMEVDAPELPLIEQNLFGMELHNKIQEFSEEYGYALFSDLTVGLNKKSVAKVFMEILKDASRGKLITRQEGPFQPIKIELVEA